MTKRDLLEDGRLTPAGSRPEPVRRSVERER